MISSPLVMKRSSLIKIGMALAVILVLVGIFASPFVYPAYAADNATPTPDGKGTPFNFLSCVSSLPSCSLWFMTITATSFIGFFITLDAWIATVLLQFNSTILNSPAVQAGFDATLSIANLGFVLAVIIIAIATILRRQTYGVKQLLWKVVVMAIVVNFGLLIAGTLITFSDGLTAYFIKQASPQGVGFADFIINLTNAFSPQKFIIATPAGTEADLTTKLGNLGLDVATLGGSALYRSFFQGSVLNNPVAFMQTILSSVFTIIFSLLILFIFMSLNIMLAVRYVYISILLILLPLAWMSWVFPPLQKHWNEWWNKFIQWVFFPPIVVFFLYLAMFVAFNNGNYTTENVRGANAGSLMAGVAANLGKVSGDLLDAALGSLTTIILAMGGLFAANKMGITLAGASMKVAGDVKGWAIGAAGRATGRAARRGLGTAYEGSKAQEKVNKMAESKNIFTASIGRMLQRRAGGLTKETEKDFEAAFADMHPDTIATALHGRFAVDDEVNRRYQAAGLELLEKKGLLHLAKNIGGQTLEEWRDANQGRLKDVYKKIPFLRALDIAVGGNSETDLARKNLASAVRSGNEEEIKDAKTALEKAFKGFFGDLTKEDFAKMGKGIGETLKDAAKNGEAVFRDMFARAALESNGGAAMLTRMKLDDQKEQIFKPYEAYIEERKALYREKKEKLAKKQKEEEDLEKAHDTRQTEFLMGGSQDEETLRELETEKQQLAESKEKTKKELEQLASEDGGIAKDSDRLNRVVAYNMFSEPAPVPAAAPSAPTPPPQPAGGKKA